MFKFFNSPQNKVHIVSDPHIGHDRDFILNPRGYENVYQHDNESVSIWNDRVGPDDTVFCLGDVIFGKDAEVRFYEWLKQVNFRHLYVMSGNHDSGYRQTRKRLGQQFDMDGNGGKNVYFIPNYYEISVDSQQIILCHYPIISWNGMSHGSWMIHGHCHNNLVGKPIGDLLYSGKCLDVGIEAFHGPVSFDELKKILDERPIVSFDHHVEGIKAP